MEELVVAVNQIAEILKGNKITLLLSIIFALAPILLTILSIVLSVRMDKQNKKMQKDIANRDSINQTRQIVLNIYDAFFTGCQIAAQANGNVDEIFTSDQSYYKWALDVQNAYDAISRMYNQAKLLIQDDIFVKSLKNAYDLFASFNLSVSQYINTGFPAQTINNAWTHFSSQYGILYGNYYAFMQNRVLHEEFRKMCKTSYTNDIQEKIEKYLDVVGNDSFDDKFKRYINIKEI